MFSLILDQIKDTGTGNESSGHLVKCFLDLSEVRDTLEKPGKNDDFFPRTYRYAPLTWICTHFLFFFNINYLFLSR